MISPPSLFRRTVPSALMLLAGVVPSAVGQARSAILGRVFQGDQTIPVAGARITLKSLTDSRWTPRTTVTDEAGRYRFDLVAVGRYEMTIARLGFEPASLDVEIHRSEPVRLSVGVVPIPVPLPPVEVDAPARTGADDDLEAGPRRSGGRSVITRQEIDERAPGAPTVFELVRRLRPAWLNSRGTASAVGTDGVIVYVDNVRRGSLESLHALSVEYVAEIWFIDALRATQRWGTGHTAGVIHVIHRARSPT